MASLESLQEEIEAGGLVNLYWIGRVNDATVRHDRDVLSFLDESEDIWLTTWGEAWSYWSAHRCYELSHSKDETEQGTVLSFESLLTETCSSGDIAGWNIPLTWKLSVGGADVSNVTINGTDAESIEGEVNAMQGWRQESNGSLFISVKNGEPTEIHFNNSQIEYDVLGLTEFWNNHSSAVTVAGHATSDLFKWSKRFLGEDNVRFTWLLTPRSADGDAAWMPYAVLGIGFTTTVAMMAVLGRENIGPLAPHFGKGKTQEKQPYTDEMKRSLDAEE